MIKIFGLVKTDGACDWYRVRQPLAKLREHKLADARVADGRSSQQRIINGMQWADLIIFARPDDKTIAEYIKLGRREKKIIVDHDDDIFNVSPLSEHYAYYGTRQVMMNWEGKDVWLWKDKRRDPKGDVYFDVKKNIERQKQFKRCLGDCHMVTVTTPHLRRIYRKYNHRVQVLPNLIDLKRFQKLPLIKTDEIRIGWQGGYSHYEDWLEIVEPLAIVMAKYPKVKLVLQGHVFWGTVKDIPKERIEAYGWIHLEAYPLKLASLNLDIGICPLRDNVFNRSKSNLKYLEYSALEVPTVASDVENYSTTIHHEKDGFLAKTKDDWIKYLSMLIEDTLLRQKIGKAAYENVKENWDADKFAESWLLAYEKVRR